MIGVMTVTIYTSLIGSIAILVFLGIGHKNSYLPIN